ncbi:MAG TPA: hypothetical protein VJR02_16465 [Pyrinomonadaceae bacterium]|nr:hypothetical protein [Pyrinomonadaceae bacterium]
MKRLTSKSFFGILVLGLVLLVGLSTDAMAQGRGRGRGNSNWDKKCAKFVNCHDARDGRWDGRGPNRDSRFNNIFRRNRRVRDRDGDRWERRRRNRDRDWDDDRRWRRRR